MNYAFIPQPKKLSAFLKLDQSAVFNILLDYQSLVNNDNFQISFSFLEKRLNINNQKLQAIIKELTELDLINKVNVVGKRNSYSINFTYFTSFDTLDFTTIFNLRDKFNSSNRNSNKKVAERIKLQSLTDIIASLTEAETAEKDTVTADTTEQHNEAETAEEPAPEPQQQQQEELNISIDNNITCDNNNDTIESIEDIIEETNTINEIEDNTEDKIITINNNNMEQIKKVLLNEQEKTTEKQVINEYQFGILLEQNGISKNIIHLVNVYKRLGFEKMMKSEKEDYNNYINQYNSLLCNYQLIN